MTEAEHLASTDPAAMLEWLTDGGWSPGWADRKLRLFVCGCCRLVWDGADCERCFGTGHVLEDLTFPGRRCPDCTGGRVGGLTDLRSRNAVEVAERYADGLATAAELLRADKGAQEVADCSPTPPAAPGLAWLPPWAAHYEINSMVMGRALINARGAGIPPDVQAALLRDVFGNPFRRYFWDQTNYHTSGDNTFLPLDWLAWEGGTVRRLAEAAYDERDFGRLPVLADALEEAGCTDGPILRHLRGVQVCPSCEGAGTHSDPRTPRKVLTCPLCEGGILRTRAPHVRGCWAIDLLLRKE